MKFRILIKYLLMTLLVINLVNADELKPLNLMPVPAKVERIDGQFRLDQFFTIGIVGDRSDRSFDGATRILRRMTGRTGLFLKEGFPLKNVDGASVKMVIIADRKGKLELNEDESYHLIVTPDKIELKAITDIGVLRGLETFLQLVTSNQDGYYLPCVTIDDEPRFAWRGLLVDACRHFLPVEVIKRNIDALAAVKMNVMHWHLTEDQGFRIECKSLPKLHEMGSDGLYYTQAQIKEIVAYADARGIRVMPEFDLPGHATAWLVGYPELASAPGPYEIERNWGIFDPTFDPTNDETYKFLNRFFQEMASLFPDACWHIGGDENRGHQWDANPKIQRFMKKNNLADNHELQNYFNIKVEKMLNNLGKTMVGWYTEKQPDLDKKYILQSWRGRNSLYESARNGYRSMLSHGFYIDLIQPTVYHYENDPIPQDSVLKAEVAERILGGEATMWSEFVGPETIDSRIWPRTIAIAERLWSPVTVTDVYDMFRRLDKTSFRLEELGLTHESNYDMMLRRLTNNYYPEILRVLVDLIEPMYTYSRDHPHVFKSYYPLTRVVDAARPDPVTPRKFSYLIDQYLANGENGEAVEKWLQCWKDNDAQLQPVILQAPILKEIETLSADLAACAEAGLEAIDYLQSSTIPKQSWIDEKLAILEKAKAPRGETELLVVDPIEKLVLATQKK